jgi:hypothetical protein
MQNLKIEIGENPPAVTATALALMHLFAEANRKQGSPLFNCFALIVGHMAKPERFPLPQSFVELGMVGPCDELAKFFENGQLSTTTRQALTLLANEENENESDLAAFLAVAKNTFA